ncbi:ArsR/SmtB family transcription factor [Paenibacillus hexagrammi]|uniref:Metalloregulator ArsR/SmtB family transcription factor n=1 Tax=Paenibacillus hexagrammi TaxID=2908839 RepID=A0ABY3SKB9_9BACL|nr:metalloregulator ArsR/SmtB family transcription factor [Paenibacillus sp. YPD9-1]UJF34406.1 metalloregulator ArsR/SmtB family transcription factor [Paenibacillus sp. YPD9-1]
MEELRIMAEQFKMLGDSSRLTILALLREKELCVCEIVDIMGMSQPNISQHLRKLRSAGLVTETRKGQWMYYSLSLNDKPHIEQALSHLPSLSNTISAMKPGCCE